MKKECIAMLLAGGQGSRLYVLTGDMAKARRALRRQVPHHRLSPVQLHQFRHRHRGRADPVPPLELNSYIGSGQPWDLDRSTGGVHILPPYMRRGNQGHLVQGHRQRHLSEHRLHRPV